MENKKDSRYYNDIPRPKSVRDLPRFLYETLKRFLSRLFYIISLVFETAPHLFITMCVLCILEGVLPVVGAYISKDILNAIATLVGTAVGGGSVIDNITGELEPLILLFLMYFIYMFLHKIMTKI